MRYPLSFTLALAGLLAIPTAYANDGQALFKSKPCVACHNLESKMLGPALKDVAAKYAGQAQAASQIAHSIKHGSSGQWGTIAMPPNAVSDTEAATLASWILELQ